MFHRWFASLSLFLVLLLSASSAAQDYDALREYHHVELGELQEEPGTYKNTEVKFKIYFHEIGDIWSPFFSPFSDGDYINFSGWSAKKHLWKKEQMVNDFPFLYIKNEADSVAELLSANKYDLLQIKGTVKSAFESYPWIEVRHVDILRSDAYTDKQLQYLIRAGQAYQNEQPTEATRYFEKGLKTNRLTKYDRVEILKHLAINYYEAHDFRNAIRSVDSYEDATGERDDLLHRIRERSAELLKMSPEERNAQLKQGMEDQNQDSNKTGLVPDVRNGAETDSATLQRKYTTLLSQHEELIRQHQSLETKHESVKEQNADLDKNLNETKDKLTSLKKQKKELEEKLSTVYQKNARLLARLRSQDENQDTPKERTASKQEVSKNTSRDSISEDSSSSDNTSNQSSFNKHEREKLLSRIRILKRRNRSLRSQMKALSGQKSEAQREIERLRDQVRLETSAASRTSSATNQDQGS